MFGLPYLAAFVSLVGLAGCVQTTAPVQSIQAAGPTGPSGLTPEEAAQNFVAVVDRVEPVAEQMCRELNPRANCDFLIAVDDRLTLPPNAYQTLDRGGRPVIAFTVSLIADARNRDEIAFVIGHESAHHIAGHIPQSQASAHQGAVLAGILAKASGASAGAVRAAQEWGATVGARSYAKGYELEADEMGAEIALRAGYDPLIGMAFFDRLPDPGDQFLGTHPPNSQRKATVQAVIRKYRHAGN